MAVFSKPTLGKVRVAVLRGGSGADYETSLSSGEEVLSILRRNERYDATDIFISKDGVWHLRGLPQEPHRTLDHIDVVWNAVTGEGNVQRVLDILKVPYTGAGKVSTALSRKRAMAKRLYTLHSLPTPAHEVLTREFKDKELVHIFRSYLHPVVVKSASMETPVKARLAHTYLELEKAVKELLEVAEEVMVEEYVKGTESLCAVVEAARDENLYALLPTGNFHTEINKRIEHMAKRAHEALSLRHHSISRFITTSKGKIYILDTRPTPEFTRNSEFMKSLKGTGWQPREYVDHVVGLALGKSA